MAHYRLTPSDFAFLWEECKRCFYLKHVSGFNRPGGPFPRIFGAIDGQMRGYYMNRRAEDIAPELPLGVLSYGEKWVESGPIHLPGRAVTVSLRGKFDAAITFDDGSYGVIDFKTSDITTASVRLYARQLHAYLYALEHPAPGKLSFSGPVTLLGLLAFTPASFSVSAPGQAALTGGVKYYDIPRDREKFLGFLGQIVDVLALPEPPAPAENCAWCQYRAESRASGL
jgi:hypothetical protein